MPDLPLVAVVEDNADERTALGRVLRASGFDAHSYASAEEYLSSPPADALCLLLDVQLGGMSGLDLLRWLQASGSRLPVIVITASDDADSCREAEHLGCIAYLQKPCPSRGLVSLLRTLDGANPAPTG